MGTKKSSSSLDVIVTGGAGFIGSHIVDRLLKEGHNVTIYDNFSTGTRKNIDHVINQVKVVEDDILDESSLRSAINGHDVVSHQAAQLEITTAMDNPGRDLEVNTQGSLNVFEAAVESDVSEVIYASSACVYGQAQSVPQNENHPTEPNWPYGVSKLAVEKYANIYAKTYDVSFTGLRYGITYGPREWYGRVMTVFLKRALEGEPPVVWGGDQVRDFVHVKDASRFHQAVIESESKGSTVFNVGTGVATSIDELATLTVETTNLDAEVVYESLEPGEESSRVDRERLPQELRRMVLDPTKAKKKLGWEPENTLRDGLAQQYDWLQNHSKRWKELSY
ncbi:NAD-dependent epimerase/dehydratase family protein [Salinibacter ruber]|uniref:NAD-dependent epimerase/dehydratase family protein n=1 Tax=Salinibacter ruber TaxID=146919 RepID=UPI00216A254F|nr:NAD-dependent epimerase/dehydratase family protein [Salinibacter ruber]MCS4100846.1 UDP-glucose 4-epimerase [Salinibacter ruber]